MGSLVSKTQIRSFRNNYPSRLSKIIQRICNLVYHILWELRVRVLTNYEDKAKRPLVTFVSMSLICPMPYFNAMFPKGLQNTPWLKLGFYIHYGIPVDTRPKLNVHKTFRRRPGRLFPVSCVYRDSTNCIKLGENQQGVVCEAKHKPCMSGIIIPSWLSKIILALQQSLPYYVWILWKK